jgi:hypothetical protein
VDIIPGKAFKAASADAVMAGALGKAFESRAFFEEASILPAWGRISVDQFNSQVRQMGELVCGVRGFLEIVSGSS